MTLRAGGCFERAGGVGVCVAVMVRWSCFYTTWYIMWVE